MEEDRSHASRLLSASLSGDKRAAEELIPLVYDDLRALAQKHLKRERPGHTLQPTALVNDAYLRLIEAQPEGWNGKTHFFAVAALHSGRPGGEVVIGNFSLDNMGLVFVLLPGGTFPMGAQADDSGGEVPVHDVTLTPSVSKFEWTQGQWLHSCQFL